MISCATSRNPLFSAGFIFSIPTVDHRFALWDEPKTMRDDSGSADHADH
jgi:hypothetical protein